MAEKLEKPMEGAYIRPVWRRRPADLPQRTPACSCPRRFNAPGRRRLPCTLPLILHYKTRASDNFRPREAGRAAVAPPNKPSHASSAPCMRSGLQGVHV